MYPHANGATRPRPAPVAFHPCGNDDQWTWAIAVAVTAALRRDLQQHPRARLLVSGGKTPAPVFRALSQAPLEWDRIDIALVDERWLRPDDPDSNAHLVRKCLLQGHAAAARFETLTRPGRSIEAAVADANLHARHPPGVVLLGMGNDGHVASLFPGMHELDRALDVCERAGLVAQSVQVMALRAVILVGNQQLAVMTAENDLQNANADQVVPSGKKKSRR